MKNIFKTGALAVLMLMFSCDSFDLDLQNDPNFATEDQSEADFVYNNVQLSFATFFNQIWFPTAWPARMVQGAIGTNYVNAFGPATYNFIWRLAYSQMFPDIDLLLETTDANPSQYIYSGSARIMKGYVLATLVDLFGDVPLSEAGQGVDEFSPGIDPGADVYTEAIALINQGITILSASPESEIQPAFNAYYTSAAQWITAGNTMLIKLYNTRRLVDENATANIAAIRASGDYIAENSQNWEFNYGTSQQNPNTRSPFYNDSYNAVDGTYMSNYFMWEMIGEKRDANDQVIEDPRKDFYFYRPVQSVPLDNANIFSCLGITTPDDDAAAPAHYQAVDPNLPYCVASVAQGYYGRDFGNGSGIPPDGPVRTVYGLYPGGGAFDDGTSDIGQTNNNGVDGALGAGIEPILQASYVHFMLAENFIALGNADGAGNELELALETSFDRVFAFNTLINDPFKVVESDLDGNEVTLQAKFLDTYADKVDEYTTYVMDQFDNATTDEERIAIIMKEYHIAAWGNGIEVYNNLRRTGEPANVAPLEDPLLAGTATFAWSAIYPQEFVNLNRNLSDNKSVTDKVFWDTNAADFVR